MKYRYITDPGRARRLVDWLSRQGELGIDIETAPLPQYAYEVKAGLDPYKSYPRLFQAATANGQVVIFDLHKIPLETLRPLTECNWWTFNGLFEYRHLTHAGFPVPLLDDLQLLDRLVLGRADRKRGLGEVCGLDKQYQQSDWSGELSWEQLDYAALDAYATIYKAKEYQSRVPDRVYKLWRDAIPILGDAQLRGHHFNWQAHSLLGHHWHRKAVEQEIQLKQLMPGVLLTSPQQVGNWLNENLDSKVLANWPKTKTGQISTSEGVLAAHADIEIVQPLLKHRGLRKMISAFLDGYTKQKHPVTGLLHPAYRIGMTATGRLSCSAPNIQQAHRDRAFRELFTAPDGFRLVSGDFSQVELRIAAALSRDQVMLDAYANGHDLHSLTAARSANISTEAVTKDMRQGAKVLNFGSLYGMRAPSLAKKVQQMYGVPMTVEAAEHALQAFSYTYPELAKWQRYKRRQAKYTNKVISRSGLVRDFTAQPAGNRDAEAMNAPIQATGAEILLAAMRRLNRPLASTVHDELTILAPIGEADTAAKELKEAMLAGFLEILPEYDQLLYGLVEVSIGKTWADVH